MQPQPNSPWTPSPLLIVFPLFLHVLSASLSGTPLNQFLILKVCESLGGNGAADNSTESTHLATLITNGTVIDPIPSNFPDYKSCAARADVQTNAALWSQLITLASSIPAFVLVPLMGKLVDRLGRKKLMILPIISTMLGASSIIVVATYNVGLWFIVAVHCIQGFMGGYATLQLCAYAFIGDTTVPSKRTQTFLFVDAFSYVAFTIGPFAGGLAYRNLGLLPVFFTVLFLESIVLFYVVFILPESLKTKPMGTADSNQDFLMGFRSLWKLFLESWNGSLSILSAPGRGSSLFILAMVTAVGAMTFAGYQFVFFFYPAQRFGWDSYDSGSFSLVNSMCRLVYLSMLLPNLLRVLTYGKSAVDKTRVELTLIRCGITAFGFGLTLFGLATEGWMFYFIVMVYSFGTIAMPTVRGMASRTIPSDSQGSLFAALELLQSGSSLISQFILPVVFRATVAYGKPQTICFVLAAFWVCALALTALLKSRELIGIEDEVAAIVDETTPILASSASAHRESTQQLRRVCSKRALSVRSGYGGVPDPGPSCSSNSAFDVDVEEATGDMETGNSTRLAEFQRRMAILLDPDFLEDVVEGSARELVE
ncbi:major facilitator superfamily domain-containing protein [Obelidium mucronatum]|nr:major facilitator superfamily domain-containing protein [Obelidium mucronatum]